MQYSGTNNHTCDSAIVDGASVAHVSESSSSALSSTPIRPSPKKRYRTAGRAVFENGPQPICFLAHMPLEILSEILLHCSSSRDILALARCSQYFCNTLVNNPATVFIWRQVRAQHLPKPIPDPTPNFTEASYAALLFDAGECEICAKKTNVLFNSFALRLRLCGKPTCASTWRTNHAESLEAGVGPRYKEIRKWLPRIERTCPLVPHGTDSYPLNYVRSSDWMKAVDEYNRIEVTGTGKDAYVREKQLLVDRMPMIRDHADKLVEWRNAWHRHITLARQNNDALTRKWAALEGCTEYHLRQAPTFTALFAAKNTCAEKLTEQDWQSISKQVRVEVSEQKDRRERRIAEETYRQKRLAIEQHYNNLKSAASSSAEKKKRVFPPLPEFRKLSIMKVLQDSASDADGLVDKIKNSDLVTHVLRDDLEKWRKDACAAFAGLLGFAGWRNASRRCLHPVERLTAWFRCTRCAKAAARAAGKAGEDIETLDFKAACGHRCGHLNKKQRAREQWSADMFVPDEKAIETAKQILALLDMTDEAPESFSAVEALGPSIVCSACPVPLLLDFETAIRHIKRHDEPKLTLLSTNGAPAPLVSGIQGAIEHGLTSELMKKSDAAGKRREQKVLGCRHCRAQRMLDGAASTASQKVVSAADEVAGAGERSTNEAGASAEEEKQAVSVKGKRKNKSKKSGHGGEGESEPAQKMYSFHGLRSHMREKHGVAEIGDEDFYREQSKAVTQATTGSSADDASD